MHPTIGSQILTFKSTHRLVNLSVINNTFCPVGNGLIDQYSLALLGENSQVKKGEKLASLSKTKLGKHKHL